MRPLPPPAAAGRKRMRPCCPQVTRIQEALDPWTRSVRESGEAGRKTLLYRLHRVGLKAAAAAAAAWRVLFLRDGGRDTGRGAASPLGVSTPGGRGLGGRSPEARAVAEAEEEAQRLRIFAEAFLPRGRMSVSRLDSLFTSPRPGQLAHGSAAAWGRSKSAGVAQSAGTYRTDARGPSPADLPRGQRSAGPRIPATALGAGSGSVQSVRSPQDGPAPSVVSPSPASEEAGGATSSLVRGNPPLPPPTTAAKWRRASAAASASASVAAAAAAAAVVATELAATGREAGPGLSEPQAPSSPLEAADWSDAAGGADRASGAEADGADGAEAEGAEAEEEAAAGRRRLSVQLPEEDSVPRRSLVRSASSLALDDRRENPQARLGGFPPPKKDRRRNSMLLSRTAGLRLLPPLGRSGLALRRTLRRRPLWRSFWSTSTSRCASCTWASSARVSQLS